MQLFFARPSPYARKVRVMIVEKGLQQRFEFLERAPFDKPPDLLVNNPLCKVPTLITDSGQILFDSPVICEFIDDLGSPRLIPSDGRSRWEALRRQALADGMLGSGGSVLLENRRIETERSPSWIADQMEVVARSLAVFEREIGSFGAEATIGHIALGCALGWLDFRLPNLDWRAQHANLAHWFARFSERASMAATRPA
jgi:glutathione S-transferase